MDRIKIIYFGTPEIATPPLQALLTDKRFEVLGIVTQEDKPAGRGKKLAFSAVKTFALSNKIIVHQPAKVKNFVRELRRYNSDFFVVCAYGQIFPKEILDIPKYGCVNIHFSLLPKFRGASPLQETILQGETKTGITLMKMEEKLDTGDVLLQKTAALTTEETSLSLGKKLSELAAEFLAETLVRFVQGKIRPVPQKNADASYCQKIRKESGLLDFKNETAMEMERKIRAFTPWPSCYIFVNNKRLKIVQASVDEQKNSSGGNAGKILIFDGKRIGIQTKKGILELKRIQLEGKQEMNIEEFARGYSHLFS